MINREGNRHEADRSAYPSHHTISQIEATLTISPGFIQRYESICIPRWVPKTRKERQGFATAMRKRPTTAESVLNRQLRWLRKDVARTFGKSAMLYNRQQLKCGYILDFYLLRCRLAVEVDGSYHNTKQQKEYDERRDRRLARAGIKTLHFTNEEVVKDVVRVGEEIRRAAMARFTPMHKRRKRKKP